MTRRRMDLFEQPSLVPMADMVTNTVGIMLFILIFVALSAGGAVVSRHLPRERATKAQAVWMFCSGGRIVSFDPRELGDEIEAPLGDPTFSSAREWARDFTSRRVQTRAVDVAGEAKVAYSEDASSRGARITKYLLITQRPGQGEDQAAIRNPDSEFRKLLAAKSTAENFFFFFVTPDSITLFRSARDQAAAAGFAVGWSPLGAGKPARISLSGSGRETTIQ